jgi:biotin carboxylase
VHAVPRFGVDPFGWIDAANAVARARAVQLIFPTHEQVTVLAAPRSALCTDTVAPPFVALCQVQDKVSAFLTLREANVAQPQSIVVEREDTLKLVKRFPVFLKRPISTASSGVRRANSATELADSARALGLRHTPLLVQDPVDGPLAMIQVVAGHGQVLARHANLRVREGIGGGASVKESIVPPAVDASLERLIKRLDWHGPISFDAILGLQGPVVIDVNPRIVEPMNAHFAGVDLVGAMLALAAGGKGSAQPRGRAGVRTRQLLLGVLGAARDAGRGAILHEIIAATRQQGDFAGAVEELTPGAADPIARVPLLAAVAATLARPATWRWFESAAVSTYALTPQAWQQIMQFAAAARECTGPP